MAKKEIKVDELKHDTGLVVDIMFNPNQPRFGGNGLTFSASVADKVFRFNSAAELKRCVGKYLDENSKLTWHPVIEIAELSPFSSADPHLFVGFEIERYYLAEQKTSDRLRSLSWDDFNPTDENWMAAKHYAETGVDIGRVSRSTESYTIKGKLPDCLPYRNEHGDKKIFIVAYDDSVWAALQSIQEGIARLKQKLRSLTGTTEGLKQLESMGDSLLKLLPEKTL